MRALFQGLATVKIRRSALSPFIHACLFITLPGFCISYFFSGIMQYLIFGFSAIPLCLFAFSSLVLLFRDRDRLHTEEFLERKHALEIVETKGQGLIVSPVDLVNMVNPKPESDKLIKESKREEGSNA